MSKHLHHVILTPEEKERLESIGYTGSHPVRQVITERLLLKAAAGVSDPEIAEPLELALSTVAAARKRFARCGLKEARIKLKRLYPKIE